VELTEVMMATRWLPMRRAVLALQAEVLPPGGRVEADRGEASVRYLDSGIRRVFSLGRLKHDLTRLGWTVFIEDATYGNGYPLGPCAVWVRLPEKSQEDKVRERLRGERGEDWENGYRRPTPSQAPPARLVFDLARWLRPALAFVADRQDLGRLLLSEADVTRGELSAFLRSGPAPARLVHSVMIARDLGDMELERAALDRLAQNRERATQGWTKTFGAAVAHWANEAAKRTGVDLSDLISTS
jgi:hypothetical protein